MVRGRYMLEGEVEGEDSCDPTVHGRIRLDIGIIQHPLDIFCVDFNREIVDANDPNFNGPDCTKKTIKLDLSL